MPRLTGQTGQGGTRSADGACLTPGPAARNFSWVAPDEARALFSASPQVFWNVSLCWTERHPLPNAPSPTPSARERQRGSQRWGGDTDSKRTAAFYRSIDSCSRRPADGRMWPEIRQPGGQGGPLYLAATRASLREGPARVRARPAGSTSLRRAPIAPQSLAPASLARVLPPAWAPQLRRQRPSDPDENFPLIRPRPPLASVYPCTIKESDLALKGLDPTLIHQTLRKT